MKTWLALAVCGVGIALTSPAWAQKAQVRLEALVASASTAGSSVDGALAQMAQDFKRNGLAFTSFQLLSSKSMNLTEGRSESIGLPNGSASITFQRREADGKIQVKVSAPGSSSELSIGNGGQVYIDAGTHGNGKIFLLLRR